jgi:hypothetical protein
MLRPVKELDDFSVHATDGLIGSVDKFFNYYGWPYYGYGDGLGARVLTPPP